MTDAIKDKIRKLLAMAATGAGTTEDEAETAMRMAAALMARHGIEESQLGEQAAKNKATFGKRISQEFKAHQILCAMAASVLYGCQTVTYNRTGKGATSLEFVGRLDNTEAAEQTMFWLMGQVEVLYKQALPSGMTQAARAQYRATFKGACANRVYHRAAALIRDMESNNASASATGSTALVVKGYFDTLRQEVSQAMQAHGGIMKARSISVRHGNGTMAGLIAGDKVKLRREVA